MDGLFAGEGLKLSEGTVIADTYRLTNLLGSGGMGTVWAADHARLPGKKVAIKVLHTELGQNPELLARFKREAEIASRLGHPNIVEVHDLGELPDGAPYIVLEFLNGISLRDEMDKGSMQVEWAQARLREMCSGLAAAHAIDIVHRDLKPENVFLVSLGGEQTGACSAKILDFGISKIRGSTTLKTQESTMLGTPQYMAPEQALGKHSEIDGRADIFALGAMAYEMLAGVPAFQGQTIPEVVFQVVYEKEQPLDSLVTGCPSNVSEAIAKAMEKKPEDRFQTVDDFVLALTGRRLGATMTGGNSNMALTPAPKEPSKVHSSESMAKTMASVNGEATPLGFEETVEGDDHSTSVEAPLSNGGALPQETTKTEKKKAGLLVPLLAVGGILLAGGVWKMSQSGEQAPTTEAKSVEEGDNTRAAPKSTELPVPVETPVVKPVVPEPVKVKSNQELKSTDSDKERPKTTRHQTTQKNERKTSLTAEQKNMVSEAKKMALSKNARKTKSLVRKLVGDKTTQSHGRYVEAIFNCSTKNLNYDDHLRKMTGSQKRSLKKHCDKVWPDRGGKL